MLPQVVERWRHSLETGEPFEMEFPLRRADGEFRWFLTRVSPLRGSDGKIIRWFGTNTDTDQQRNQAAALEAAIRSRDTFLSVASHELKTPLTSLTIKLQALSLRENNEVTSADFKLIGRQVRRLTELVNELLDVARLGSGQLQLKPTPMDLVALVREVVAHFEADAQRAGSTLQLSGEGSVWGAWDGLRVEQIVSNLLSNALKYGAGKPVRLNVEKIGDQARISVFDEGIGIAAEAIDRIFDKFERAVSDRHYGGLGLGLFVSRQLAEAMGGSIAATSRPGHGATFTVTLPLEPRPL